jgi:SanA protein
VPHSRALKIVRYIAAAASVPPVLLAGFVVACSGWIALESWGRLHDDLETMPPCEVALVLGTSDRLPGGGPNLFFRHRMEAAAALYHAGAVRHLLVSGDNRSPYYNEPRAMQRALVELGVPAEAITLDYAGLRTLDSVVRAREIFGQEKVVIVTQRFHNRRAVFLANRLGLDAIGFNAEPVRFPNGVRPRMRELLARCKAVLDVTVLNTQPRHLGDFEPIVLDVPAEPSGL